MRLDRRGCTTHFLISHFDGLSVEARWKPVGRWKAITSGKNIPWIASVHRNHTPIHRHNMWQPDVDIGNFPILFYVLAFAVIPWVAVIWNVTAWLVHRRWMKTQHKTLEEGEPVNEPELGACCFDDEDCEELEVPTYQPPRTEAMTAAGRTGQVV